MQRPITGWVGDVRSRQGRLKLLILVTGLLLVITAITGIAINATSTPQFCSSCHEMRPEYLTWQVSSHKDVSCIQCHVGPGLGSLLEDKFRALGQVYEHVTGKVPDPIRMAEDIPNVNCLRCHNVAQNDGVGDIRAPHSVHLDAGLTCVTCHRGVAHGTIAERGQNTKANSALWDTAKAQQEMQPANQELSMKECLACHQKRGADTSCLACHTKLAPPDNHNTAGWPTEHGLAIQGKVGICAACHGSTQKYGSTTAQYAQANPFCSQCHTQRPPSHTANWVAEHKAVVSQKGRDGCLVCHSVSQPGTAAALAKVYCNQCHNFSS